jgi:uncharacterized membrane protein
MTGRWFLARRLMIAGLAAVLSGAPELTALAQETTQSPTQNPPAEPATAPPASNANQPATNPANTDPDSPGAVRLKAEQQGDPPPANAAANQQTNPSDSKTQSAPTKPLGTAAAEPVTPSGVAASQPAGAALAPAKQRRTRSLLIKVGAIVGGGVALGTIFALSNATSSKPPGSH